MYNEQYSQKVAILQIVPPSVHAASGTAFGSGEVDMSKFRRVRFIAIAGAITSTGTIDMSLKGHNTAGTALASKNAISSSSITQMTSGGSVPNGPNSIATIEVSMESAGYRYVEAACTVATATANFCVVVVGIDPRYEPASGQQVCNNAATPATSTNIAQTPVVCPNLATL